MNRCALAVLTIATACTYSIAGSVSADDKPTYVFEGTGLMVGQPPVTIAANEKVQLAVIKDEMVQREQLTAVIDALTAAIEGVNTTIKERSSPAFLTLGIVPGRLEQIRNTYCQSALRLVATLPTSRERDSYEQNLAETCPALTQNQIDQLPKDMLPKFATGLESYRMSFMCRNVGKPRTPIASGMPASGYVTFEDTAECAERSFDLRLLKPVAGAVDDWQAKHPMNQTLRLAMATAREGFKTAVPALRARVETHKALRECLLKAEENDTKKRIPGADETVLAKAYAEEISACVAEADLDKAYKKFLDIRDDLDAANRRLRDIFTPVVSIAAPFAERWLWLTSGRPTLHPLAADTIAPLTRQIEAKRLELDKLDAQLATLEKLTTLNVKVDDPAKLKTVVEEFTKLKVERNKLATEISNLEKKVVNEQRKSLRDTLLYQGVYFASMTPEAPLRMQHHDAAQQYVIMGAPLVEVSENERVVVLAENADPSTTLKILQTVTPIATDRTKLVDELRLTAAQGAPPALPGTLVGLSGKDRHDALIILAVDVAKQYDLLVRGVAFADLEITTPPTMVRFASDDTPARVTRPIPQDVPRVAPADVAYTINEQVGTETKEVGKGGYRRNRLYRARLKTGLLYSTLEQTNIKTDATTNISTEEVSQHGVDALFGVSTYIGKRRDPRTIDSFRNGAWSLLTAFTMRDPTENLLVGIGYEPYGGVTITFGEHIGRSERIRNDPGQPAVEDEWRARPFFGVTFDVDFLKQLFAIKPAV